jgi:SAM-dependent methyltransferase
MNQEGFVRQFHRDHPGVTAAALARGRVVGTRGSSYDRLATEVVTPGIVVDLGCGDGYLLAALVDRGRPPVDLIGIDVSDHELRAAAGRLRSATWLHARAQSLPLATARVATVVSHLAWTLMPDLPVIVSELARVLAPGGRFVTVVGGGPREGDAFAGLLAMAERHIRAAPPTPRLGDRRARTDLGLDELLSAATGFTPPRIDELTIDLSGSPDEVWRSLATGYELANLTAAARGELRAEFIAAAPAWRRPDGTIAATMYARLVVTNRRRD